jgi:carbonic anhydrase
MSISYQKLVIATATVCSLGLHIGVYAGDKLHSEVHWSYSGNTGPQDWGSLSDNYALCNTGQQQSPVNITKSVKADLPPLEFNYKSIPLIIQNNGHTIKVKVGEAGSAGSVTIGEDAYQLVQFHFHSPSEHAINTKHADMVAHLVHNNPQTQTWAAVAIFLEKGESANPLLETLWKVMPKTPGEPQSYDDIQIDINQLLPDDKNYLALSGSITTPPCWEGVRWNILKQPMSISAEQLAQFQAVYLQNVRPLQPLNDRQVQSSN